MRYSLSVFNLGFALPVVRGLAFNGPAPTNTYAGLTTAGTTPRPTSAPSNEELKRRQSDTNPETCGCVDGVYSLAVTCPGLHTCMLYTAGAGMAGCCDGTNTQDCGWATSCVDAAAYRASSCSSSCLLNTLIRKRTQTTAPHCITFSYPSENVLYYGCDADLDSIISSVLQHATDDVGGTTNIALLTVTANPVTTGSNDGPTYKRTKKLAMALIVGIVVVALFVISCIAIGILFFLKKRKKQRQIAASAQAMAAVKATRPEPHFPPPQRTHQYPPQQQHHAQTQSYQPSLFQPSIDHQATTPSYFPTIGTYEEKPGVPATVHEYAMTPVSPPISPPMSSPSTPAPVYTQPHGVPPPMPMVNQYHTIVDAQEVDATSMPHIPNQAGPVHEIGAGK